MAKRPLHLDTPRAVRAAVTKVVNEVRNNELTPQQGNAIVAACNTVLQSIRVDEQEKKLAQLESLLEEKENT